MYRIGVEDNGCHSLMDYDECAETAKVLEYLARSLNAVVLERKMIQNEVVRDEDGVPMKVESENGNGDAVLVVLEPSLLGDGKEQFMEDNPYNHHHHHDHEDEKVGHNTVEPQPELAAFMQMLLTLRISFTRISWFKPV